MQTPSPLCSVYVIQLPLFDPFPDAHSEILPESPWNSLNEDVQDQSRCKTLMADKNFIGFDFKRAGYRTMLNEDMSVNLFHEARCKGWGTTPADHYPRLFNSITLLVISI